MFHPLWYCTIIECEKEMSIPIWPIILCSVNQMHKCWQAKSVFTRVAYLYFRTLSLCTFDPFCEEHCQVLVLVIFIKYRVSQRTLPTLFCIVNLYMWIFERWDNIHLKTEMSTHTLSPKKYYQRYRLSKFEFQNSKSKQYRKIFTIKYNEQLVQIPS